MTISTYLSIITLNVNGLNAPIKRYRVYEGILKKTHLHAAYKKLTSDLKTHRDWKWKYGKRYFMQMEKKKKAGVAILISDKINFQTKTITKEKEGHCIMIKGSIQEEDMTFINMYEPNIGTPKYVKQILTDIKEKINSNTRIVGTLILNLHQLIDHPYRKWIRKPWS